MTELEERARRLLDVARSQHDPSAMDAARVRSALRARVAAEPGLIEQPMRAAFERALPGQLLVAFGAGGLAGFAAGVYVALAVVPAPLSLPAEPAPRSVPAAAEHVVARTAETAMQRELAVSEATPNATSAPPGAAPPAPPAASPAPAALPAPRAKPPSATTSVASRLKAELDGLRRAQELLHQGQPAWALARLTELDRAEVGSVLLEERTATRAIAECMLGKDAQAQTQEFRRRFPKSAHLERVRSSCTNVAQSGSAAPNTALPQTESRGPRHE